MKLVKDKSGEWPEHKKYFKCTFNGVHIEAICLGADEDNGWADVVVLAPNLTFLNDEKGKPITTRIHGKVRLIDTRQGES
jgi:hypothetical protein